METARFFTYSQNNSGGRFTVNDIKGIGEYVIVQADSYQDANDRAKYIGLYFDGCNIGVDCDCCGDRWHRVSESDANFVPSIYGDFVDDYMPYSDSTIFVHYLDGTVKKIIKKV